MINFKNSPKYKMIKTLLKIWKLVNKHIKKIIINN